MKQFIKFVLIALLLDISLLGQVQIPGALGSEVPPLQTGEEAAANNVLTLGLRAGSTFDDNALNNNLNKHSDIQYDLQPLIRFTERLRRLNWDLQYEPGVAFNQHFSSQNYFSQRSAADLSYRVTNRFTVSVHGSSSISSNPFDRFNQTTTQLGPLDQPNLSVALPRVKQITEEASMGLDYELSAHTFVGATGSFSDLRYHNLLGTANGNNRLIDTRVVHGRTFIGHRFSQMQTIGVSYDFMDLTFPHATSRTQTHSWTVFDEINLHPNMSLTIYVGPQYSHLHDQLVVDLFFFRITLPVSRTMWSPEAGADFDWQRSHTGLRANFARRITDGGGLIGAVQSLSGAVRIRQDLSKRWKGDIGGQYARNDALGVGSAAKYRSYSGGVGLTRILTRDLSIEARYERVHQTNIGTISGGAFSDHNRASLSLIYQWQHPLGR